MTVAERAEDLLGTGVGVRGRHQPRWVLDEGHRSRGNDFCPVYHHSHCNRRC
jgi:hypothetical protein